MDIREISFFDALSKDRAQLADALDKPALRGVKNSVVEKYSDQAHFVYELLQNADDAKATSARFVLYNDRLVFAHNGTRRFTVSDPATEGTDSNTGILGDINAITSIANSNKLESSIGKFGVGFKAVFQYTSTPHIYDPNVFFKIDRFIVPSIIESDNAERKQDETLFMLPFDHAERNAEEAFEDISEKLRSLDYPLLFLSSLHDITFEIFGGKDIGIYGKKIMQVEMFGDTLAELICHTQIEDNDLPDRKLWLFTRKTDKGLSYSVGYFIDDNCNLTPKKHTAFCFFPTKEETWLNFIFHAPFLLTDSRENIKAGVPHNKEMIELLAELAADSFILLKDIGQANNRQLITDDIFDIIPFDETVFGDLNDRKKVSFKQFYIAIKEKMESEAIIPTQNGYVSKENAYWAEYSPTTGIFSDKQLAELVGNKNAKWVFPSLSRGNYARDKNNPMLKYIDSIIHDQITEDKIISRITGEFIETQEIEWLHKFYKWVSETKGRTDLIRTRPIFLNKNREAVSAYEKLGRNEHIVLFLPVNDTDGYVTINPELLNNDETLDFIDKLGIKPPSLKDEIYNKILKSYKDNTAINPRPHFAKFFQYYNKECPRSEIESFIALIRDYQFVLFRKPDDDTLYRGKASTLYFPFESLIKWFEPKGGANFVQLDEYVLLVGEENKKEIVSFLTELGVKREPCILSYDVKYADAIKNSKIYPYPQEGHSHVWTDRSIDGCEEFINYLIEHNNIELSIILWNQLLSLVKNGYNANGFRNAAHGKYDYFRFSQKTKMFYSSELHRLRTMPWLLNDIGVFCSANMIERNKLAIEYDTTSAEALELIRYLEIKNETINNQNNGEYEDNLTDEQRAKIAFADMFADISLDELEAAVTQIRAKKILIDLSNDNDDSFEDDAGDETTDENPSVTRVVKDIEKRTKKQVRQPDATADGTEQETDDEDDFIKPSVDFSKKIEQALQKSTREVAKLVQLEELTKRAIESKKYTFGWFKALLELESLNSVENNPYSREVSIGFAKVEREPGTIRTLILKHPNRYIPQSMEDLADIPLVLHFRDSSTKNVAIEVVSVKSYTLRAKLKSVDDIESIDLSLVREARIEAKNPVFLLEELKQAFSKLGFPDDFNMQENLCDNIEFIFGPPGTGKTTHLAMNVIIPIMKKQEDKKILVLTPTNKAADVIVNRIMDVMNGDESYMDWLVRFGTTNDSNIEESGVYRDKTFDIMSLNKNVTITTIARFPYDFFIPNDGKRNFLHGINWDYIIVDEASMIPLVNIVYPLYKKTPKKFIIAGDPFQIEPITSVSMWKDENIYKMVKLESFNDSKTIPHDYHVELLTTQYRSVPSIGEVFSKFAYGGVLDHDRFEESRILLGIDDKIEIKAINIVHFPVSKYESIYRCKRLKGKSNYQIYSAIFTFEFAKHLSEWISKANPTEVFKIGIIAPYRAQSDLIDKLMLSMKLPYNVEVQVGTIHGFQGDECDIIISVFNPPPSISASPDMFLNKRNIVNVSISRARDYLFIVMPDDDTEKVENLTFIKRVENLCMDNDFAYFQADDIENIIWGNKSFIEENSFSTSHQTVNVYGEPERRYEIRSEEDAVDIQIHDIEIF